MAPVPVVADASLRRVAPGAWLGGSPLRLFRLSRRGDAVATMLVERSQGERGDGFVAGDGPERRLVSQLVAAGAAHPRPRPGSGPGREVVSVVVPVRGDPEGLARLLGALPPDVGEVVVVDDGSVSADAVVVAEIAARHRARCLRHESSRGPGAARDTGAAVATGEVLAFLDADVEPAGSWLEPLLDHLAEEGVAVVAPRVRSRPTDSVLGRYERLRSPLDLGDRPARVAPGTRVAYLPAAALVVRRSAFEALGGFDERLRLGEDVDLVWRAVEAGLEVRYEPASTVQHRPRSGWKAWARQRLGYGTSATPLDRRHPGMVAPVALSPWSLAVWSLVAAGHPLAAATTAAATAAAMVLRVPVVPPAEAVQLVLRGHLGAGAGLARAAVRAWWPLLVVGAAFSSRIRRLAVAAVVVDVAIAPGPPRARLLGVVDDAAYGAGVWVGATTGRSWRALAPRLVSWP